MEKLNIIIIGSGLSGLTASIVLSEYGHSVLVLEKNNYVGGNSVYATSGINAAGDDKDSFIEDINKSTEIFSKYTNDLIHVLVNNSNEALEWLKRFNIVFDEVVQLGGHSIKRTYRNSKNKRIGEYIVNNLLEHISTDNNINISLLTKVDELIFNNGDILGVKCKGVDTIYGDGVIVATGGYSSNKKILNALKLPTTNDKWAVGDGIYMGEKVSAAVVDIDSIQIHPTGFIDPKNPKSKIKTLAPEYLRGLGGMLFDLDGNRFCNELDTRRNIYNEMKKYKKKIFYLVIPASVISEDNIYVKNGLLKLKKYDNIYSIKLSDKYKEVYIGRVTPCVHYSQGGLIINKDCNVIDKYDTIIPRLYAVGETTGGLHGMNRLGGNSLLETIVFGKQVANTINKLKKNKFIPDVDYHSKKHDVEHNVYTLNSIKNTKYTILYDKVYDLTDFIHPGVSFDISKAYGVDYTDVFDKIHNKSMLIQLKNIGTIKYE